MAARSPLVLLVALVLLAAGCTAERPASRPASRPVEAAVDVGLDVDAPEASLLALVVTPGAVERRVSVWQSRTDDGAWVLALSDDGFATRRLLEVPAGTEVAALGAGRYALREGWDATGFRVVGAAPGADRTVRVAGPPAPLGAGEALLSRGEPGRLRLVGVAADGRAHPVPAPRGLHEVSGAGTDRIAGLAFAGRKTYHWSEDGGATWRRSRLGRGTSPTFLARRVPTASGQPHVVLEGSDGATLFPFVALWRAPARGGPWTRTPIAPVPGRGRRDGHVTTTGGWMGADGEVRVLASVGPRSGMWRVAGGRLDRVRGDRPRVVGVPEVSPLLVETGAGVAPGAAVWVGGAPGEAWCTVDDGRHWTRFATR
ncbi:hypothetical protein [Pimelobacter sp. 30-1]|uniref:hypothetical protein n=1 Tax=Pimelobacter sp. 30-1 TaxID=2004991 RepID=UPI001C05894C|nr:hypothetical protein [Pimelobacter sp. 30-1]MBU2696208.1 hypothetical protein [Pimelobacter sp. 30-1]